MLLSYKWLKEYFDDEIPSAEKIAELFSNHSYEVEGIEGISSGDSILDLSILPNRAHDSLCHRGVAKELGALTSKKIVLTDRRQLEETKTKFKVRNLEEKKCPRYIAKVLRNIEVKESPEWLKNKLVSIGQKPINNIVDSLNYTMFDMGQPMHAFDLDKLSGEIVIKNAENSEKIKTLDNKDVSLSKEDLVISDNERALAIAGVKGGKDAEVSESTTSIIVESANFNQSAVRRTSRRLGVLTDASKRFENGLAAELAEIGMREATALIVELAGTPETVVEESIDIYPDRPVNPFLIGISLREVNSLLGTNLEEKNISSILNSLGFTWRKVKPLEELESQVEILQGKEYAPVARVRFDAPEKFSCSSLTNYLFIKAGFALPSISVDQYVFSRKINEKEAHFGDLVFSNTGNGNIHYETKEWMKGMKVSEGVDHVGLYLGDGKVFHTSRYSGSKSLIEKIEDSKIAFKNLRGFGRIIENPDEERFVVEIPPERLDLRIKEDLVEEIGRIYGLDKIEPVSLENNSGKEINKNLYWTEKIKDSLALIGFDEVNTYSFDSVGELELDNPISKEMPYLRSSLLPNLKRSLELNLKNAPLLGLSNVNIFELGKIFKEGNESYSLGLAGNKKELLSKAVKTLESLGISNIGIKQDVKNYFAEVDLSESIKKLPTVTSYDWQNVEISGNFKSISSYPFILRDIAVWIPEDISNSKLEEIIQNHSGEILKNIQMFDKFQKEARVSYAYHLVFQSNDKTLTDLEINEIMEKIYKAAKSRNFEIR